MDNFFHQRERGGLLAPSLQILNRILHWLTGMMQLTEKEQEDAGIYPGRMWYE